MTRLHRNIEGSANFEVVEIEVEHTPAETEKAIQIIVDSEPFWCPLKMISENSEVQGQGDEGTLIVSKWWAERAGLLKSVDEDDKFDDSDGEE